MKIVNNHRCRRTGIVIRGYGKDVVVGMEGRDEDGD